jgi:hypothetical protein
LANRFGAIISSAEIGNFLLVDKEGGDVSAHHPNKLCTLGRFNDGTKIK